MFFKGVQSLSPRMCAIELLVCVGLLALNSGRVSGTSNSTEYSTPPMPRPVTHSERLMNDVRRGYNMDVRPVYNESTTTNITMMLLLAHALDLDERMQKFTINAWVTLIWKDEFLTWDPKLYGGIERFMIPSNKIWLPEVILYNSADDEYKNFLLDHMVKVKHTGAMLWAAPTIFQSTCHLDVRYFPFDHQVCSLKFGPWQYSGFEIMITGEGDKNVHRDVFMSDGEWDMVDFTAINSISYYPDEPGVPFADVTYYVSLRRRPVFYVINLLLPCALLSVITMFVFILPVESGEKINFGITILLSMTVFLLVLAESMPPSSVIPLLGQFYAVSLVLVTMSVSLSAVVVNLHHSGPERSKVPYWVKKWILHRLGNVFGYKLEVDLTRTLRTVNIATDETGEENSSNGPVRPPSPLLDRKSQMTDVAFEVRELRTIFEQKEIDLKVQQEWRLVAMVMDRLFMTVYGLSIFLTIMVGVIDES
ncbi:neuronal acetylcholine receptor subunit alpha-10-like [Ptychodera flava]|uniref:neuronal acetylcholine receptor subunit alpha-10-like n=1 Tax=Ptychodera flava TaxID=63121 RepID=UPI00396A0852